jgi:nucleotide-binding universal stress UspA family protein
VTLATVGRGGLEDDDDVDLPPIQGAQYLARHGIECEMVELPADGSKTVAGLLSDAARSRNAGLIVMGAYGQPRLLETLLGGATRDMLSAPPLPLLLAN